MSIEIMSMVWKTDVGPATHRLVLLALADAANDEGVCWPSMAVVAMKAGCGLSTARKAVAELEADNLLIRQLRPVSGKRNQSNVYQLNVSALEARKSAAQIERESKKTAAPPQSERDSPSDLAATPAQTEGRNHKEEPPSEPNPSGGSADAPALFEDPSLPDQEPEDKEAGTEDGDRHAAPPVSANVVVAAYVDSFRVQARGKDPIGRYIAQVGREAKKLLEQGATSDDLLAAAKALGRTPYASLEQQYTRVLAGIPTAAQNGRSRTSVVPPPDVLAERKAWFEQHAEPAAPVVDYDGPQF
jgi:hypothetical protein